MQRAHMGEIFHLMAARSAGGHYNIAFLRGAHRGQQLTFRNGNRDGVVFFRIAEGARHTAAAGVEIDDFRAGDA